MIPLVGPFSSAGPFQTGGTWYYFIMSGFTIFPYTIIAPWILMTSLYVLFVYLIIKVGEGFYGKLFGIIVGLLASVSTAQIAQSTNLTNQGPEAIIGLLSIWSAIEWIRKKKEFYLFILGFLISLGISIHMQAVALLILIPLAVIFGGVKRLGLKGIFLTLLGLLIPHIPLLLFDFQNDFVNLSGMFHYFLYDQYKISLDVLGRRWLTYAGIFWPNTWAHIISGQIVLSYIIIAGVFLMAILTLLKRKIDVFVFLITALGMMIGILRYIRTPLYDSYLVFLNPFVLFLTSYIIFILIQKKKIIGIMFLTVVLAGSLYKDWKEISQKGNLAPRLMIESWQKNLAQKYPGKSFSLFDYKLESKGISFPLVYYLYSSQKIDEKGIKVGVAIIKEKESTSYKVIAGEKGNYQLFLLSDSGEKIGKAGWFPINPSYIYNSTENWRKTLKK